jgi:hypothetical protein
MKNCEKSILEEIADKKATRDSIATTYAFCLKSDEQIDWPKVNKAIMERWSFSGLKWIKEKAWKMMREKHGRKVSRTSR